MIQTNKEYQEALGQQLTHYKALASITVDNPLWSLIERDLQKIAADIYTYETRQLTDSALGFRVRNTKWWVIQFEAWLAAPDEGDAFLAKVRRDGLTSQLADLKQELVWLDQIIKSRQEKPTDEQTV